MQNKNQLKVIVTAALMAAFTCIATMVIQLPTPTMGYIHLGDALVILCGIILGPFTGGLAAGLGSMMADVLSGYVIYAVPTLVIKALTAAIVGICYTKFQQKWNLSRSRSLLFAAILGETNVVFGYFINKIVKTMFMAGLWNSETFSAGLIAAFAGAPLDALQGGVGIILALSLFPLLYKVSDIRLFINQEKKGI